MKEKICIICKEPFFSKSGSHKICSDECRKINHKQYYKRNEEKIKKQRKVWTSLNREHIREKSRHWYHNKNGKIKKGKSKERYTSSLKGHFQRIKSGAKYRKIEFLIDIQAFEEIVKKPCYYCNSIDFKKGMSGLDRIDSDKPYIKENLLPCCYSCNIAKHSFSYRDFLGKIGKIFLIHEEEIKSILNNSGRNT